MDRQDYAATDFRKHPERYLIGRGEQGVLTVQPYKSELLPHWTFKTPADAERSAAAIYELFVKYKGEGDFVGMDMARKYLQMGFTRSRRYANHPTGRKYSEGKIAPQSPDWQFSDKARSAEIFKERLDVVRADAEYRAMKLRHAANSG